MRLRCGGVGDMNSRYWILQLGLKRLTYFGIKCPPSYSTTEAHWNLSVIAITDVYYRNCLDPSLQQYIISIKQVYKTQCYYLAAMWACGVRAEVRCDTYMCSLAGFWPTQIQGGTRTTPRLCPELLCRCGRSRGPCSCSSSRLYRGQRQRVRGTLVTLWNLCAIVLTNNSTTKVAVCAFACILTPIFTAETIIVIPPLLLLVF